MESFEKNRHFVKDIVDGMYDWVRVIDREDNILFMNKAMSEALGMSAGNGSNNGRYGKCYELLGRREPCVNCTARRSVFNGTPCEKEEYIGDKIFSVMCSPIRNQAGEIISVVEVFRETTNVKKLQQEIMRQNKKLADELNIAKKLQKRLLPDSFRHDRLEFAYVYKPCDALGGDFLDIFKIDSEHVGFYLADVSGHGIPASMLTVFLKSSLDKTLLSPSEALKKLYAEFNAGILDEDMYITVFYAILDLKKRTLAYSNAGHNINPLILGPDRREYLRLPGVPISSWVERPEYGEDHVSLDMEDILFFSSDGIVEMRNQSHEQFGMDRLLEHLSAGCPVSVKTLEELVRKACDFSGIEDVSSIPDDISMALLKLK